MQSPTQALVWNRLNNWRKSRRVQTIFGLAVIAIGPILAGLTYAVLGVLERGPATNLLRLVLLADLVYILVIAALVLQRVARMIAARRAQSAGSRLHLRLTGVFAFVALLPTILVAIFAMLTVNMGLEGWFSERVRQVVGSSLAAAEAYESEQRDDLLEDANALAFFLNSARANAFMTDGSIRQRLASGQAQVQRGLKEAYVISGTGEIRSRGDRSYLFDYEEPDQNLLNAAKSEGPQLIRDWNNNEFRALVHLPPFRDHFLYVSRIVDGNILNLLDETKDTVAIYQQLENERGKRLFEFGLIYIGFALILILAAIWMGLGFAERLSRPVGRLAGAVQRVGAGDLEVQVPVEAGDDEIAMLGRGFNQMTRELKGQRQTLLDNTQQIERRRRVFDSVLSNVTSGVMGLDDHGQIDFMNRSARRLLAVNEDSSLHQDLRLVVPEFSDLFSELRNSRSEVTQKEVKLTRGGKQENLLVRMSQRRNSENQLEGFVVAFDDVTDLVSAQRMAAWGDVARRIAHEIKNPLTPIQLSAERLKRKFAPVVGDDADSLIQMTEVIVRQTNDLRRIVDEFSKFARMPEPEKTDRDIKVLVRDAVTLQKAAMDDVILKSELPDEVVLVSVDQTMISQAMTNLIKNAGEAIESLYEKTNPTDHKPEIRVKMVNHETYVEISISDNGIGLPVDRSSLFEPYVTTRSSGTGLGLPIVKKIIEEHGGSLALVDAAPFGKDNHFGAKALIKLPKDHNQTTEKNVA